MLVGLTWYSELLIAAGAIASVGAALTYLTKWGRGLKSLMLASRKRLGHEDDTSMQEADVPSDSVLDVASRASLRRAGMLNPLVSRYEVRDYAPPFGPNETGAAIRVVLAASQPPEEAHLDTKLKAELRDTLVRSSLERWFAEATDMAANPSEWTKDSPNTDRQTTWKRSGVPDLGGGSLLTASCRLQLPVGLMGGPYLLLILDVVEQAVSHEGESSAPRRLRFTLPSLYSFLHTLARTAIHDIGTNIFPPIFGNTEPVLLGPNLEISFGDRTLNDLVLLPKSFDRPSAAYDRPWAYINTPDGTNARDLRQLDAVLRQGVASILRQNEYDGIEDDVAALAIPDGTFERSTG